MLPSCTDGDTFCNSSLHALAGRHAPSLRSRWRPLSPPQVAERALFAGAGVFVPGQLVRSAPRVAWLAGAHEPLLRPQRPAGTRSTRILLPQQRQGTHLSPRFSVRSRKVQGVLMGIARMLTYYRAHKAVTSTPVPSFSLRASLWFRTNPTVQSSAVTAGLGARWCRCILAPPISGATLILRDPFIATDAVTRLSYGRDIILVRASRAVITRAVVHALAE